MLNNEKYKDLSSDEFFLYILLLNRLNISKKNSKRFCDNNGFFIYYTNQKIAQDLRCSHTTAIKTLKTLENAGLIHKEYQKNGLPLKIYVNDIRENTNTKPKVQQQETSFDIDHAISQTKANRYNFGEMKNSKARHKKTT